MVHPRARSHHPPLSECREVLSEQAVLSDPAHSKWEMIPYETRTVGRTRPPKTLDTVG